MAFRQAQLMMARAAPLLLLTSGLFLFIFGKQATPVDTGSFEALQPPSPAPLRAAITGPCIGAGADFSIFRVYSIFAHLQKNPQDEKGWRLLYQHLSAAQQQDPWFWDVYRLSTGLLGFREGYTENILTILEKGARARTWDWETPFLAGFLAYDQLNDHARAFALMSAAAKRENAPPIAARLAARFLSETQGVQASIDFLNAIAKTMPPEYQKPLLERIRELKSSLRGSN